MSKIKVEEILEAHLGKGHMKFLEEKYTTISGVKEAIKEIVEAVINKAAGAQKVIVNEDGIPSSVKRKKLPIDYYSETSSKVTVYGDKQSILKINEEVDYE